MSSKECLYCGKMFSRSYNLRRHLDICTMTGHDYSNEEDEFSDVDDGHSEMDSSGSETEYAHGTASESENEDEYDDEEEEEDEGPWSSIQDEALARHEGELQEIIIKYQGKGESLDNSEVKAYNDLLPVYRKELRKVFMEKLEWLHDMKRDPLYRKIMKTRQELMDTGDYDWREAVQVAINSRKFLLNDLFMEQEMPDEDDEEVNRRLSS